MNDGGLYGHTVAITGAGRGLGRTFAHACGAAGAAVIVLDVNGGWGERTVDELRAKGIDASFIFVDLADPASVAAAGATIATRCERLDGLVNNGALATGIGGKTYDQIDIETWDRVMTVNVRGTWLMTRACAPMLRASGRGRIVNLASDTALWGAPRLLHYVASKGAVISMTRALARELGGDGVTVNAIAPGIVVGESTDYVPAERHEHYLRGRAIPRAQLPDDVSGAVVFLLSPGAGFITGQLLPVNGGFVFH